MHGESGDIEVLSHARFNRTHSVKLRKSREITYVTEGQDDKAAMSACALPSVIVSRVIAIAHLGHSLLDTPSPYCVLTTANATTLQDTP